LATPELTVTVKTRNPWAPDAPRASQPKLDLLKTATQAKAPEPEDEEEEEAEPPPPDYEPGTPEAFLREELRLEPADAKGVLGASRGLQAARVEDLRATLAFLREELEPRLSPWAEVALEDPRLLVASAEDLADALAWLEEFLWNQEWAAGFGRQALADAILHYPRLLHQGVDALEETTAWLERHGVDDAVVARVSEGAVPYPTEPYPWLELLQAGAQGLEAGAAWAEQELGWEREEVSRALRREPHFLLAAATAAGAAPLQPRVGCPVPAPEAAEWITAA